MKPFLPFLFVFLLIVSCKQEAFIPVNDMTEVNITGPSGIPDSSELKQYLRRYVGKVGEYDIMMLFANWGNGFVQGRHDYTDFGVPLDFYGQPKGKDSFLLTETRFGEDNAWFEGKFDGPLIHGVWWNVDHSFSMPFEMRMYQSTLDSLGWTGVWHLNDIWHKGTLIIGEAIGDQFDFLLSIDSNNDQGDIYGTADVLSANRAVFQFYVDRDYEEPCKLVFYRKDDFVKVEQHSFPFLCGFERIAYADGKYYDIPHENKPELYHGNENDSIFTDQAAFQNFKTLVGEDFYQVFAYTMQRVRKIEIVGPEDDYPATAFGGALVGLQGEQEAIIMQDSTGNLWAATVSVDPEIEEDKGKLYYFTNVEKMKNRLPEYFDTWRKRFSDLEIVYMVGEK